MKKYAPDFSKVLVTPDPHYIPGYTGYCPQLKYSMGKSYARLTADLLTCPDVKHSSRLVLSKVHIPSVESDAALTLISLPHTNLKMIPGYTGFIPQRQKYIGCRYSEACHRALSESHQGERMRVHRQSTDLPAVINCTSQQCERPKPPLAAVSSKAISYKPLKSFTPPVKPYLMDDEDLQKYFISGFTGHVPKSRFLIGKGYPIITNQALIQFGRQQRSDPTSKDIPGGKDNTTTPMPSIYPSKSGVVPLFTGHIPGYRFMYGQTFGQLSQSALEKSGIKRIYQGKS